jgi:hypothetical protein
VGLLVWRTKWQIPPISVLERFCAIMAKEKSDKIGKISIPRVSEDWTPVTALLSDDVPVDSFLCNFDFEDQENGHLLYLANQVAEQKADELIGKEINLLYWIVMKKRIPDRQNGGECDVVSTILIDNQLVAVSTMSTGVLKSLELFRRQAGTGPLSKPVPMVIIGSKTGAGSSMLQLVPQQLVRHHT